MLFEGVLEEGPHEFGWEGRVAGGRAPAGMYFAEPRAGAHRLVLGVRCQFIEQDMLWDGSGEVDPEDVHDDTGEPQSSSSSRARAPGASAPART